MQDLLNTLEASAKGVIDGGATGVTIYPGQTDDTKTLPHGVVYASGGDEFPLGSGNYEVDLEVTVRSNAEDSTLAEHQARCQDVLSLMTADGILASLTAQATNFSAQGMARRGSDGGREEDSWTTSLRFVVYCCLRDV